MHKLNYEQVLFAFIQFYAWRRAMATFTNQATLRYNGNIINSNVTTGELLEVLSATKTAVTKTYKQGSDITYVINIVNSGSVAYTGLTITDNLAAYVFGIGDLIPLDYVNGSVKYYINGVLQPDLTVETDTDLVINGITVPANGVATIIYVARTNQYAPLEIESQLTNTAVIGGDGITDITVTETVTPENGAQLTINKSMSPTTVTENGRLTYTFVIQNSGNTAALVADNVIVTDTFNPILKNMTVTYNGAAWTEQTNYTYSEDTGLFSTVAGQITVPNATYTQDSTTGEWIVEPGVSVITVTGTV